ncbi:MAG: hypothetical protein PHU21_05965 [Elusimicrobia bacterium]|nr:hypothetical protein [Elusimicrobiota bacterium]
MRKAAALVLAAALLPCALRAGAVPGRDPLAFVVVASTVPGDGGLVRSRLKRSLASPTARGLAARYAALGVTLVVEFAEPPDADLWAVQRVDSGTAVIALAPFLRQGGEPAFGRAFWHEACHALAQAEADRAGIHLWDLFFDDELSCYAAGEVIRLELGGAPDIDEMSSALALSTAGFAAAMLRQESNGALTWEETADPLAAWRARQASLQPLKKRAGQVFQRVPVWRYRIRKVVAAGLIGPGRLQTLGYELDASERTRGGLDGILRLEKSLDRRLEFFASAGGAWHLRRLAEFRKAALPRRAHAEVVALQARYRRLAARRSSRPGPAADAGGERPADWRELQAAYESLRARDPGCCADEPPYDGP